MTDRSTRNDQGRGPRDGPAPLVSIGLPVYNGQRFLAHALDSLLAQTERDFELIISDNASSDETQAICERYAARDARIRYVRQQTNIGAPRNWNFVAQHARGTFFKWSSANDYCEPTLLERCVAAMRADPSVVLCHGRTCLVDEDIGQSEVYPDDIEVVSDRACEWFSTICAGLRLNNAQSGVMRLDALKKTRLDRPYPGGDKVLMAELALIGKFVLLPDTLLYRRMGRATFSRLLTNAELQAFFDPAAPRAPRFGSVRLHADILMAVATASMPLTQKLCALRVALRYAAWDRKRMFGELGRAFFGSQHA